MKVVITERQLELIKNRLRTLIKEAEYNFHFSHSNDRDIPDNIKDIRPYVSDNIIMMRGRGTGHFGSGMYFSTYSCENWEYRDDVQQHKQGGDPNFSKIKDKLYRVDLDLYKNLYKIQYEDHGTFLFKTLKEANNIFYRNIDYNTSELDLDKNLSSDYLKLKNNLNRLGLDVPRYKEFIKMIIEAAKNINDKKNIASFSTRIMEYNGYNGVNASGIPMYDNTRHGSVIYDLSKVSADLHIAKPKDLFFCDYKKGVVGDPTDEITKMLRGEIPYFIEKIPVNYQIMFMKRYDNFISDHILENFDQKAVDVYYRTLPIKLKNNKIEEKPDKYIFIDLIKKNKFNIITDINNKIDGETMFLLAIYQLQYYHNGGELLEEIAKHMNREFTPEEKKAWDYHFDDSETLEKKYPEDWK